MNCFDFIIIGAGPAGLAAAREARRRGFSVAVVSRETPGGTCVHRGCVPVKSLLASAAARRAETADAPDWSTALARAHEAASRLARGAAAALERCGAHFFLGEASAVAADRIRVTPSDAPSFELSGAHVLFAAGASPVWPAFLPESRCVIDSDAALRLPCLPRSAIILGGGAIGCEFASIFADFGVETCIVERAKHLLPDVDGDAGVALAGAFARRGVRIAAGAAVVEVCETAKGVRAVVSGGGVFEADVLLVALGRRAVPNTAGFSVCGDAAQGVQLAPWAEASARAAVAALCGEKAEFNCSTIPSCVFSFPEVATVGLSEVAARTRGMPVCVGRASFRANARAVAAGAADGFAKVVLDPDAGRLLGASIVGPCAAESIAAASLVIGNNLPVDVLQCVFPHPSFGEVLAAAVKSICPMRAERSFLRTSMK